LHLIVAERDAERAVHVDQIGDEDESTMRAVCWKSGHFIIPETGLTGIRSQVEAEVESLLEILCPVLVSNDRASRISASATQ
jgi:hypothetical protein